MKDEQLRLMVVDDHPMIRSAIVSTFKEKPYIVEVLEAGDGLLAIKHLTHVKIDVVLLDISMPNMNGIQCIKEIKAGWPQTKVIILTQFSEQNYYDSLMSMGADGYLLKSTTEKILVDAFEQVVFQDIKVTSDHLKPENAIQKINHPVLGEREIQILALICNGLKSHEIADSLNISLNTVNNHRKAILKKTQCRSTLSLMDWAKRNEIG